MARAIALVLGAVLALVVVWAPLGADATADVCTGGGGRTGSHCCNARVHSADAVQGCRHWDTE